MERIRRDTERWLEQRRKEQERQERAAREERREAREEQERQERAAREEQERQEQAAREEQERQEQAAREEQERQERAAREERQQAERQLERERQELERRGQAERQRQIADTTTPAPAPAPAPASGAGASPPRAIHSPRAIREAQALLAGMGYVPGPADGLWGRRTERAYRLFLRDAGLPDAERLTPEALQTMRAIAQREGVGAGSATPAAAVPEAPRPASGGHVAPAPARARSDALHRAARTGDIAGFQALLQSGGVDLDVRDDQGWTALMHAVDNGNMLLAEWMLAAGAEPNTRAPNGATALFMAVLHGYTGVIEVLMEAGARPKIKAATGKTAMDLARMHYGEVEAAKENGEPPAVIACWKAGRWRM